MERDAQDIVTLVFQGDQRDEEEESQMKKSESEVEVRAGEWQVRRMGGTGSDR